MLAGLALANLIDLDHVYYRIIGKVPWFSSACEHIGMSCSFNFYPLHNIFVLSIGILMIGGLFFKKKKLKFVGWFGTGIVIHIILDLIMQVTGYGI